MKLAKCLQSKFLFKKLTYYYNQHHNNFSFNYFPAGMSNLLELHYRSNFPSNFFNQLSKIYYIYSQFL
jgi:hypothetical protein